MPDFEECRPYVQHMLAEHRRLHKLVQTVHDKMVQANRTSTVRWTDEVLPPLQQMREELAHHFVEEEQGGCMEEAVSHAPRLSAEMDRIEAEHPKFLVKLDEIVKQAADHTLSAEGRIALEQSFTQLCQDLQAHETAENRLLRIAFATDVNGEENSPAAGSTGSTAP